MKTNFKCMYLIDTQLYKKKILDDKTLLTQQPSIFHYSPPNKVHDYSIEKDQEALPSSTSPVLTEDKQIEEFNPDSSKVMNNQKTHDSNPKNENETVDMDCDCTKSVDTTGQVNELMNVTSMDQCKDVDEYKPTVSRQKIMKKKKNKTLGPSISQSQFKGKTSINSNQNEKEDEQRSDDELKERLYRLRYDYPEPTLKNTSKESAKMSVLPSESDQQQHSEGNNGEEKINYVCTFCNEMYQSRHMLEKHITENHRTNYKTLKNPNRKPILTDSKSITYVCTICENRFKRFNTLSRHMKNIHPDYFEEWSRIKKRKNEIPHSLNKKFKHDGRQKRKLDTREGNELKKVKKEFRCSYCDRFYKSIAALQKHINNIHTSDGKGEKRKNMNKHQHDGMYVKRNKGEPHKSVQYINYFE